MTTAPRPDRTALLHGSDRAPRLGKERRRTRNRANARKIDPPVRGLQEGAA
jgi:hypothetical protein